MTNSSIIEKDKQKFGRVSLIGAPNAGKSTLINKLVGTKISIVTHKVQTTRGRVVGIVMRGNSQIVLIDTPGIFKPNRRLDKAMVKAAWSEAHSSDIIALLIDASHKELSKEEKMIISELKKRDIEQKVILILNKIDIVAKERLLKLAKQFDDIGIFSHIFMLSALTGDGCDELLDIFDSYISEGGWQYDPDIISDMPARLLAAEITREKIMQQLHQEIPYSCAVETESWGTNKKGELKIGQVIYVAKRRYKAILLGKRGQKIKKIGTEARLEISELLEQKTHLNIFVKVKENWQDDPDRYEDIGLEFC